jgi:hypothetical protein
MMSEFDGHQKEPWPGGRMTGGGFPARTPELTPMFISVSVVNVSLWTFDCIAFFIGSSLVDGDRSPVSPESDRAPAM